MRGGPGQWLGWRCGRCSRWRRRAGGIARGRAAARGRCGGCGGCVRHHGANAATESTEDESANNDPDDETGFLFLGWLLLLWIRWKTLWISPWSLTVLWLLVRWEVVAVAHVFYFLLLN